MNDKPDEAIRGELKAEGFRWAPSQKAWQRQLTVAQAAGQKEAAPVLAHQSGEAEQV